MLGQHTEEICQELLKMSPEEIQSLKDQGVLEVSTRQQPQKK
jgi:crotonobetainyl-CoA:carnitine CoA-transferase CaiB-like acyl-CoA transferase